MKMRILKNYTVYLDERQVLFSSLKALVAAKRLKYFQLEDARDRLTQEYEAHQQYLGSLRRYPAETRRFGQFSADLDKAFGVAGGGWHGGPSPTSTPAESGLGTLHGEGDLDC